MTGPDAPAHPTGHAVPDGLGAVDRPTVSFELFPPRNPDAAPRLWSTVQRLAAARPDFVSVTYGASGSTRTTTRQLVRRLLRETSLTPIAHLTCVASSRADLTATIEEFLDEGVRAFLALRGDPPADRSWEPHPEGLPTASALVELLRDVERRRCAGARGGRRGRGRSRTGRARRCRRGWCACEDLQDESVRTVRGRCRGRAGRAVAECPVRAAAASRRWAPRRAERRTVPQGCQRPGAGSATGPAPAAPRRRPRR